jgi:hypothetical protein
LENSSFPGCFINLVLGDFGQSLRMFEWKEKILWLTCHRIFFRPCTKSSEKDQLPFDQLQFYLFCSWIPPQDNLSQLRRASHLANGDNFSSAQWFIYQRTILSLMKQILFTPQPFLTTIILTTILDNHHYHNHSRQPSLSQPFSTTIIITTILDNHHYHNHSRQPSLSQPFSTTIIITTILYNHHYHNQSLLILPISILLNRFLLNTFLPYCSHFPYPPYLSFLHLFPILITTFSPTNYFCHNLANVNPSVNVSN